ncbi:suppressor of cytokine signaling 1 [Sceloporus undulatus]|uniref:suppressor of cytokine signaling 1 n=1 Tax=Sceloporus undulatus TaxID=8520 RepID=UPI001C4B0A3D|nr:suppressor of cytokine signaling 1 [Sceloporus undulatus]
MVAHSSVTPEHGIAAELRSRLQPPPARESLHGRVPRGHVQPGCVRGSRDATHFPTFRSQEDFGTITRTSALLDACGFYWGPLSVSAAHEKLKGEPVGTFLIRDSRQTNCFFTVSVKMAAGPTSIRVIFQSGRFHLDGSKESFGCLFALLEHYVASPRKVLSRPLRKEQLRPLQELCRKSIVATFGRENLDRLPLNPVLKDYLESFPFKL